MLCNRNGKEDWYTLIFKINNDSLTLASNVPILAGNDGIDKTSELTNNKKMQSDKPIFILIEYWTKKTWKM